MKCPKCSYIGFEQTDRCRNCGYDFALAQGESRDPDLPLRGQEAAPLADFDLGGTSRPPAAERAARRSHGPDFDPRITPPGRAAVVPDLPLFGQAGDDLPIVPAAAAMPPLAVRRSTPPAAKSRPRPTPRVVDAPLVAPLPLSSDVEPPPALGMATAAEVTASPGMAPRILASVIDAVLLLGADAVVVYFTLEICRLALSEVLLLPLTPLVAFLLLLNGGYLVLMTAAGGQTIGKMAFGLKVVSDNEAPVPVVRSLVRASVLMLTALPAGLGLLPALFADGHRGLHDRLADTRVVRA